MEDAHINRNEILQRLAHLRTLDMQMSGMEEVVDPGAAFVVGLIIMRFGALGGSGESYL